MYGEEYDIYIIADEHSEANHADLTLQLLQYIDPEVVIEEDVYEDGDVEEYLFEDYVTLFDAAAGFAEEYGEDIFAYDPEDILDRGLELVEGNKESSGVLSENPGDERIVPDSLEELVTTPVYDLHPYLLDEIINAVEQREQELGGRAETNAVQSLSEDAKGKQALQDIRKTYEWVRYVKDAKARKSAVPRLGNYLSLLIENNEIENHVSGGIKPERMKSPVYDKPVDFLRATGVDEDITIEEKHEFCHRIEEEREQNFAETITDYAEKTDEPVVALIGSGHLYDGSTLLKNLDASDTTYRRIFLDPEEPFSRTVEEYLTDEESDTPIYSERMKKRAKRRLMEL